MERKEGRVLHYQLLEKLGAGGMGEIYKAQDTRLNRSVAIKVLPASFSSEPERQRRFIQEAQAASALNHPNIITIHDIIADGGMHYMVMEYVSGKTLLELIPVGGLRVPQVLRYASQMADALSAAHAAGIIHRDLKPANVMVTNSGLVKLLDFGLAKWTGQTARIGSAAAAMATATGLYSEDQNTLTEAPLTVEGSILGTLNYMSPEQAEGKRVDARSDIFSFGAVLYEMATGRRAFDGDSTVSTLSSVLRDEVMPINVLAPDVPPELEDIIARCLRKDPDARWQAMKDVELAITNLKRRSDSGILYNQAPASSVSPAPAKSTKGPLKIFLIAAGVLLVVAIAAADWWIAHRKTEPARTIDTATEAPALPPAAAPAATSPAPAADSALTNQSIIEMMRAKVPTAVIFGQIRSAKTNFDLSTEGVIELTRAGVPAAVIEVMRNPARPPAEAPVARSPVPAPAPAQDRQTASASTAVPAAPPAASPANAPATVRPQAELVSLKLKDALPFRIVLTDDIPADAAGGQSVSFRAADGLTVGDMQVIAKGAIVHGEVMGEAGKKKFLGMGGSKLSFRLSFAESVEDGKIRVRATGAAKADTAAIRPFDTGKASKSKELAAARGTEYVAYIDGEQTVSIHKQE